MGISLLTLAVSVRDNQNEVDPVFSFDFSQSLFMEYMYGHRIGFPGIRLDSDTVELSDDGKHTTPGFDGLHVLTVS